MRKTTTLSLGLIAILAAACSSGGASSSPAASTAPSASTAAVSTAPSVAPSPTPDPCAPANLTLATADKLTIGTDNPAFPPYFAENAGGAKTAPWELGDPTNGQGFESAVAYAIAAQLGFTKVQVAWTYVPFANSYKPGPKGFDFDINQVSFSAERAQAVDMSDGYYFVNQAVVALAANPVASVTTVSGLAAYRFGAQVGTTSYKTITDVIKPTKDPSVYDTNDAAISALKAKQIDAIVVDLPTAFYMTGAQLDDKGKVVGQFQLPSGTQVEHFSLVLAKGSTITPCVNGAIKALTDDGTLAAITKEWLSDKASAPVFTP
jgi:ABC-type amino acid transport/signal transduction systems, periplasmic component/domain